MSPSMEVLVVLLLSQSILLSAVSGGCPVPCICKWKGGKQTVECRNQGLETLPEGIDPETQVLDISGNKLGFLPQDAFRRAGLLNLQKIHLRNSRLTHIDGGAFSELINLVEIDLSDNLLTAVPTQAFKTTPFVRDLNLGGNPIQRLKDGAFQHLSQLVKLDVSRCQLVHIDDQAFAHLQILESLKINSNHLTILTNRTVKSLSQLHGIEVHDNPWECDCRLRDLKLWIETKNIPHPISPTCHTPPRLAGRKFSELPVSEFACPPRIVDSPRVVQVVEGENATFECEFEAVPDPTVKWYWYGRLIANNTLISSQRKFFIFEDANKSLLVLTNTLGKDTGDFFCVVENAGGMVEANFTLEIVAQPSFHTLLDTSSAVLVVAATVPVLIVLLVALSLFLYCTRCRGGRAGRHSRHAKQPEILATSTPVKPPRLNYEINPGSLVHPNGYSKPAKAGGGDPTTTTDNPDLILETNNSGTYQETTMEDGSSNSELNWEQVSYRNLGYNTEYPPDYGLPIIHENSVYSDSSFYGVTLPNGGGSGGGGGGVVSSGLSSSGGPPVMSGVWNKNKVGARITAPNARDSPDEGYQEGYVGTDVATHHVPPSELKSQPVDVVQVSSSQSSLKSQQQTAKSQQQNPKSSPVGKSEVPTSAAASPEFRSTAPSPDVQQQLSTRPVAVPIPLEPDEDCRKQSSSSSRPPRHRIKPDRLTYSAFSPRGKECSVCE